MSNLRLLTLNLHCLEETDIEEKQHKIIKEIIHKEIDIIFLQEVAQYLASQIVYDNVKESNYAYQLQRRLHSKGHIYHLYFDTIKQSFGKYDEGIAILSRFPLHDVKSNYISKCTEYHFWRTRKMIKGDLQKKQHTISLVSAHLGWSDKYETFEDQVERLNAHIDTTNTVIIAGDFNVSPKTNEYTYIISKGLHDLYGANPHYLFDPTHINDMDVHQGSTRIDYIFSNHKLEVLKREILFTVDRVSDHYGVYLEIKL